MKCSKQPENKDKIISTITLKNAEKIFPCKYTKVLPHDLISIREEKKNLLNKKERDLLEEQASNIKRIGEMEYFVERVGNKIKFIKFDDDN